MDYPNLLSPKKIGAVQMKNRVVVSAMMLDFGQFDGTPTERMMDYYEERAKGGAGLIITEITRVNDVTGAGSFAQLALSHDYQIKPMSELVARIHKHGCKVFVQLHHAGWQAEALTIGTVPIVIGISKIFPSFHKTFYKLVPFAQKLEQRGLVLPVAAPSKIEANRYTNARARALRHDEIRRLVKQFIRAAERAQRAGADGVELHASHGYLIQQFLSPYTNHRTDEYGGTPKNRMRFLLEIIEGIKKTCGQAFPVSVRLTVDECYDRIGETGKGYTLREGVTIAARLEQAGVDAINVSSAGYETMNYWIEPTSFEPGWRKYLAAAVKETVSIPVIAANLIRSPEQAEQQIAEGVQDFVALGRPHLADPRWTQKVCEGRPEDIRRCTCCLWCFESMQANAYVGKPGECAVNPAMGYERELREMQKNGDGRLVVVVGAGPAGLTAASILAQRGFRVTVFDKQAFVGGQLQLADKPPMKEKLSWCYQDMEHTAKQNGAEIFLNTEATAEEIIARNPYAVIIATGGKSIKPGSIPGIAQDNVCTVSEILNGSVRLSGKHVALVGSGMTGLETAEKIAQDGNAVTVVEMADRISPQTYVQHLDDLMPRLKKQGVAFLTAHKLLEIDANGVKLQNLASGEETSLPVDHVVLSIGVRPENKLYKELEGRLNNLYLIGDANAPGRIGSATRAAFETAISLN